MSLDDLAAQVPGRRKMGVSHAAVQQWESDETKPELPKVEYIALALAVDPSWLLTGQGPAPDLTPPERIGRRLKTKAPPGPIPTTTTCTTSNSRVPELNSRVPYDIGAPTKDSSGFWCIPTDVLIHAFNVNPDQLHIMRVTRGTMSPEIQSGEYVMIDRSRTVINEAGFWGVVVGPSQFLCRAEISAAEGGGLLRYVLRTNDPNQPAIPADAPRCR
ncbi:XRE family transcriptional regulator [Rhodopseudomonas palustris]|nr:XRE family transcriptional regulator [Rhodopseudomonas palustris]